MAAVAHLQKSLRELRNNPPGGFRIEVDDDLFKWTIWFLGPSGTVYHPGVYKAQMTFPADFPFKPPEFKILSSFWHPNIYTDGKICISILHAPGTDEMNTLETASMRWTPVQSIEKVLVSIISVLSDPDPSDAGAPANVDALVEYRKNRVVFDRRCRENAEKSLRELPAGFVPIAETEASPERQPTARQISSMSIHQDDFQEEEDEDDVPFGSELSQIRSMGVGSDKSDEHILGMLTKYKGDVSRVLELLM